MNCLVTGGAGFIGSNLVDRLLAEGNKVIVVDDLSLGTEENLKQHESSPNLQVVKKSICDDLSDIFRDGKFNVVFHLAAYPMVQYSIENPKKTHEINVNGTLNLLNKCKDHDVKRFVFSSSCAVYGSKEKMPMVETDPTEPISPYALHKLIGEKYCKLFNFLYGLETVCLRYFNVFGPRQNPSGNYASVIPKFLMKVLKSERPIIFGDGKQTRDLISVFDVVNANIAASKTKNERCFGEPFNIGSGVNLSVNEIAERIISLAGESIVPVHGEPVMEPKDSLGDVGKARDFLGWAPKESFDGVLKQTLKSLSGRLERSL